MTDWPTDIPILIAGPTAAGKTDLAIRIAQAVGGDVINADALQIYDCWHVLSARPTQAEMAGIPHHLFGHVAYDQPYSVGHWLSDVADQLTRLRDAGAVPVIVGGTGLYFMALTEGLAQIPEIPQDLRAKAQALFSSAEGRAQMLADLQAEDPNTAARIDIANPVRIQRAWSVLRTTGQGLAAWQDATPAPLVAHAGRVVLMPDRDWLAARIDRRFELMVERGALREVDAAIARGWDPGLPSSKAIGAAELVAYRTQTLTRDDAIATAQAKSRQYAKRQRSWFRKRMKNWLNLDLSRELSTDEVLGLLQAQIRAEVWRP